MVGVLEGIGVAVGIGTAYGALVDILRNALTYGKWKALKDTVGYPRMAQVMQEILNAEKDEVHGLSTKGMIDVMWNFIDSTIDLSFVMGEQTANQLFIQMIQQSVAYAIHASHAGSIGTVCNVYSGSQNISSMQVGSIGENSDLVDRGTKGFLTAGAGLNIPSTAFELFKGANIRIETVYRSIIGKVDTLLDEWNDLALGYYRHYHTMSRNRFQDALEMKESVVTRAYGFLEQVANEHLARISEQLDTLEGAKAWFDGGLMSSDELMQIALRVDIERQASEDNFDNYKSEVLDNIETAINEWETKLTVALDDMKDCEYRYSLMIRSIFSTLFADVRDFVSALCDEVNKTVEDVCAYRNIRQAVSVDMATDLGEFEMSPEMEIFAMRYTRWKDIPWYTNVCEYQRPSGIRWSEDETHDKGQIVKETYTSVPRRRFEEIDFPIITTHTQPTPLTPWESVG